MENNPRRQFLTDVLHGMGVALLACVPGTFFNARKAWSQVQRVAPVPRTVSGMTTIKTVLPKTTQQNVIQVLKTAKLLPEDKLAVLSVRQLGAGEVRQSLDKYSKMAKLVNSGGTGDTCGDNCGDGCGEHCGTQCGFTCGGEATGISGAFCGGGCSARPGVMGVVDRFGQLGINFTKINTQRFQNSINEVLRLVR